MCKLSRYDDFLRYQEACAYVASPESYGAIVL